MHALSKYSFPLEILAGIGLFSGCGIYWQLRAYILATETKTISLKKAVWNYIKQVEKRYLDEARYYFLGSRTI